MRISPSSMSVRVAFVFILTLATAPPSTAKIDALSICTNEKNSTDRVLTSCTELLNDAGSTKRMKIIALLYRGGAQSSRDLQLARVDLDQALKSYDTHFFSDSDSRLSSPRAVSFTTKGSLLTNIEWAQGFNSRGDIEANALNFNAAIRYYREAARINPWNDSYESSLGASYRRRSAYANAITHLNRAIELNANSGYNYLQRGLAYKVSGDLFHAENDFRKASTLYSTHIDRILANAHATGRMPRNLEIYYSRLGDANLGFGDTDDAIYNFNKALSAKSDYKTAFNGLGQAYRAKGRYDLAIQNLTQAITIDPKYALAYAFRGQTFMESARIRLERKKPLHEQKIDLTRAQEDLKRALYLDPSLVDAHANFNDVNTALARVNAEITQSTTQNELGAPATSPPRPGGKVPLPDSSRRGPGGKVPLSGSLPSVAPERRLAFSVGNKDYPKLRQTAALQSPLHDAQVVRDELKELHFQVTERENLTHDQYLTEYEKFVAQIQPGDTVLIYFSGHGAGIRGVNLFLPTDTPQLDPVEGARTLLSIGIRQSALVTEAQAKGAKLVIVISDACRDDPFASTQRVADKSLPVSDEINPTPVSGALMIYAAGQGQIALDGPSPHDNSLFTRHFAHELLIKNQDIISGVDNTKELVAEEAALILDRDGSPHRQFPAFYDETLGGKIYLNGAPTPHKVEPRNSAVAMKSLPTTPTADSDSVLAPQ